MLSAPFTSSCKASPLNAVFALLPQARHLMWSAQGKFRDFSIGFAATFLRRVIITVIDPIVSILSKRDYI